MPTAYPCEIKFDLFKSAQPDPLLQGFEEGSNDKPASGQQPCPRSWGIEQLTLSCGNRTSTSFSARDHAPLAAGRMTVGRINFAPTQDTVTVAWALKEPSRAESLTLELFANGSGVPIWSRTLDARQAQAGTFAWNGRFPDKSEWIDTVKFPDDMVTAGGSPYMLKARAQGHAEEGFVERWSYFDVVLDGEIGLDWGSAGEIPDTRPEGDLEDLNWTLTQEAATLSELTAPGGGARSALSADHTVQLESNLFRDDISGAHLGVEVWKKHWGTGPRIPIVAHVRILSAAGAGVAVPKAVGAVNLIWDWEDPRASVADPWKTWVNLAETTALNQKLLEKFVVRSNLTTEPKSFNCATAFGGKVGSASRIFPAVDPGARFKSKVDALAGQGRDWAAISHIGADASKPGQATVLFQPSRMAGDQYKLSVYLANPELDLSQTGPALRAQAADLGLPQATTGKFEVTRKTTIYSLHPAGTNTDWTTIRDSVYRPAGVSLQIVDRPFTAAEYQSALKTAVDALIANKPMEVDIHMCFQYGILWDRTDCAVPAVSYAEYIRNVRAAFESNFIFKIQTPAANWSGAYARASDQARYHTVFGETVGSKHYIYLLAGDNNALRKGDRISGLNFTANAVTLGSEPETLTVDARRRLFQRVFNPGPMVYLPTIRSAGDYANRMGQMAWVKELSSAVMTELAAIHCAGINVGAFVFQFPYASAGDGAGGSCLWDMTTAYKAFAWAATPPADNTQALIKTGNVVVAHEFGHTLFLHHANNTLRDGLATPAAPVEVEQHLPNADCLMSYDHDSERLCGICMLHLRGWDSSAIHSTAITLDEFKLPGALVLLQADINAAPANPWAKVRYFTALSAAKKHESDRDTYKVAAGNYITALATGGQVQSTRISVLRNIVIHSVDWLDSCQQIVGSTLHGLYRELAALTSKVGDVANQIQAGLQRRGVAYCDHKITPRLTVTTAPTGAARGVLTLNSQAPAPNPLPLGWAAQAFDGVAELTTDRSSVNFFDAAVGGNPVAINAITGGQIAAPLIVYAEDAAPDTAAYNSTHQLKFSGGSQLFTVPADVQAVAWPQGGAAAKLKVKPSIAYIGSAILVGADPARTPRRPITLKIDRVCDAVGVLECSSDALEFWTAAVGGNKVALDGAANAFTGATLHNGGNGLTLHLAATKASAPTNDAVIKLTLNPGKTPLDTSPAELKLTAVELKLSTCMLPPSRDALGERIPDDKKLVPGRFVHLQDNAKHARIPVIIEKAKPADFKGKLCLQETSAPNRLQLFASATPARGEKVLDYYTITNDDVPNAGKVLWVQGATTSGALADCLLDLGIKDGKGDGRDYFEGGDQIRVTVIELQALTASLPATPALHAAGYRQANRGMPRAAKASNEPARTVVNKNATDVLEITAAAHNYLTLLEGSGATAASARNTALSDVTALAVTVVPAAAQAHVVWAALRNSTDHATVKGLSGVPTLTVPDAAGHPERATLGTNGVGCFHIVAYVDPDPAPGGPKLSLDQFTAKRHPPCFVLNVALVRTRVIGAPTAVCNSNAYHKLTGTLSDGADFGAHFQGAKSANLAAQVELTGGGADGKLGLEQIVCGWVQNTTQASYPAKYRCADGTELNVHQRFVRDPSVAVQKYHGEDYIAYPGSAAFAELTAPFLDTFREAPVDRFDAPRPAMGDSAQVDTAGAALGQRRNITMSDGPSRTVEGWHPNAHYRARGAKLVQFSWDLRFRAHIAIASNAAPDLFMTLGYIDWSAQLNWTVNVNDNFQHNTIAAEAVPITVAPAGAAIVHAVPVMGVDANAEFCWPSMIYAQMWDATEDPLGLGAPG